MFGCGNWDERLDELERRILADEAQISRLRARQARHLRELDEYQIDTADAARTMGDWVAAHLDLSHQISARLMTVAHADHPEIEANMSSGKWGLDRAALLCKLRQANATPELFSEAAERYSLGRLYGLIDRLRHLSPADEQDLFESRYLVIQPNLDQSAFKLWGQLPSSTGREARGGGAASRRADPEGDARPVRNVHHSFTTPLRLSATPYLPPRSLGGRNLPPAFGEGTSGDPPPPAPRPVEEVAEVFVDADLAAESFGEAGATVSSGPRVGPNTLSEILCTGKIR